MKKTALFCGIGAFLAAGSGVSANQQSRINPDFLEGRRDAPEAEIREPTRREKAMLIHMIARAVRPHWRPQSTLDGQSTTVTFRLNRDGSLASLPNVVKQIGFGGDEGLASEHAKMARFAIIEAAPFNLPEEFYPAYETVTLTLDWSTRR
ncbi:hypothetical protein K3165_08320 [Qipengyuania sp. 1XM1-15A]|uniref:hypothetical protein n=1 Tax=Qipengyuania xiamenensis TaxID=2867237 RepID=UPI001C886F16|nr:hypothetical protein [Qipengyuania xiamenensis]MBX7532924.1 hypothetical protein [Qipengyuania xiamenensis]